MLRSLGENLDPTDFLVSALGAQHSFLLIQASNPKRPLVVKYDALLAAILKNIQIPTGTAVWGGIGPGTGVGSQTDLVNYLNANFYPLLSNPAGYVTSSSLAATLANYVTNTALAAALLGYVPTSRTITINGVTFDLSANRSWTVSGGSAAWGSIGAGTGVGSQADLVAYLVANFYPLASNPASYVTASSLASTLLGYVTNSALASALAGYVQISRTLTINGVTFDLSANRTWNIPVIPPESVYPYERRQYYKAGENRAMSFYQDKLFMANGTVNTVMVVDSETVDTLVTTGGLSTANTSVVLESMVTPEHWCTQLSAAQIVRHNAVTGAFIANTTPTGVVTTGIQSKFLDFNATKAIGFNITNVYTINPTTFVTANLAAHGLNAAAQIPSGFVNRNPLSAQFEHAMIGSVNGIILYNCNTNAITVSATNLGGAIGTVLAVNYITSTDTWVIATLIGGLFRLVFIQVASATTFTVITTRRDLEPANITLPGGNINQVAIVIDEDFGYIFVVVNSRIYVLSLVTYLLLKSVNLSTIVGASVRPSVANIDRANKRFFWCTGGSTFALTYEMLYA